MRGQYQQGFGTRFLGSNHIAFLQGEGYLSIHRQGEHGFLTGEHHNTDNILTGNHQRPV
jgi:hypothetical protein